MRVSADDLLKTRPVPELRDMVNSLALDADNKQIELQLMVGSKYHDFIESADAISLMKDSTQFINNKLKSFEILSLELLEKTKLFMSQNNENNNQEHKRTYSSFKKPDISLFWKYLENFDSFNASKVKFINKNIKFNFYNFLIIILIFIRLLYYPKY